MSGPLRARRSAHAAAALALALAAASAAAQPDVAYPVTAETRALADGAPAVVRLYDTTYEVDGPGRATTRVRLVATALSPAGREFVGRTVVIHGGFRQLRSFEGVLRDADGAIVAELGRRDAEDRALGSIYEDLRVRTAELYGQRYPFTVEWTYEIEHRGVLSWPTWRPQPEGRPLETARFRLNVPAGTLVRSLPRDVSDPAVQRARDGRDRYDWQLVQRAAAEPEPFGPPWWEQAPELRLGTDRFEIGGAPGRLDSWEAFGAWYGGLSEGRRVLPEGARAEVHRIIAGADSDRERARRLYRHLQETTRYVSIQLGLGGWQPFDAAYVFERRYGDCKALTNYMQALLAEAGIEADPVLIRAGRAGSDLDADFPDNEFNHVILRLPMRTEALGDGGPIWLECTSPYAAFGHLGSFTEGRPGLLVGPEGGEIVHTPVSAAEANRTLLQADVRLEPGGAAAADLRWALRGEPRTEAVASLDGATAADRAAVLRAVTGLPSLDVIDLDLGDLDTRPDEVEIGATLRISHAARRAGDRLLLGVAPFVTPPPALPATDARTQPLRLGLATLARDSVRFVLPTGYEVHRAPPPVVLESVVGRYAFSAAVEPGGLVVTRELAVTAPSLPASEYEAARAFFAAVAAADAEVAVLRPAAR